MIDTIEIDARIAAVQAQRNEALDRLAILHGRFAVLSNEILSLKKMLDIEKDDERP